MRVGRPVFHTVSPWKCCPIPSVNVVNMNKRAARPIPQLRYFSPWLLLMFSCWVCVVEALS